MLPDKIRVHHYCCQAAAAAAAAAVNKWISEKGDRFFSGRISDRKKVKKWKRTFYAPIGFQKNEFFGLVWV